MTTPTPNFLGTHVRRGRPRGVARLRRRFEHVCDLCPYNAGVGGSNPSPPTTRRSRSPSTFRSSGVSTHSRWCLLNPTKIPQTCAEESLRERARVCCFAATLRSPGDPTNPTWGAVLVGESCAGSNPGGEPNERGEA